ncbi:LytTR family DNA-binding domain-containing protein [Spirosoma sp. SC4-14]|uniref:LytR/AlgR family response regulator transcription factor n=1 Tax=Spirosoma sp. SC4-14 TaxID=3128900 RepID=UPI0030CCB2F3
MFKLLKQPFPVEDSLGRHTRRAAIIGVFVSLFLLVFQPFGISDWQTGNKLIKLLGFGWVTFIITAFNFIIWPYCFPKQFSDANWTVGREILLVMINVLLIAIANRLYLEWLTGEERSIVGWGNMILITFLIAVFPVTGAIVYSYISQLKKYSRLAAELPIHTTDAKTKSLPIAETPHLQANGNEASITLIAENEKDTIQLLASDLLYIESSDNYSTIVYLKKEANGQTYPTKPLIRSSLSRLEGQINQPHIVRCHRSYIVNLDHVERITGNAQGYKLHLLGGQFQVPVARKYNDTLVAELKAL